jgi:PD-(D/E)XK nuclease superfamily
VHYNDAVVGEYFPDLLVEDVLLVELKTVNDLDGAHRMQCTNYLKATGLRLCLLLNFGKPRLAIKRVVNGLRAIPNHLRVQRESASIRVQPFLSVGLTTWRQCGTTQITQPDPAPAGY